MVIGLSGKKGSGKTLVANKLLQLPYLSNYKQYALASPIKEIVNTLFEWGAEHSEGSLKEEDVLANFSVTSFNKACAVTREYDLARFSEDYSNDLIVITLLEKFEGRLVTPREVYQWFGTDFARNCIDNQIWLKLIPVSNELIITDVRFDNEAEYIQEELGGYIVELLYRDRDISDDTHSSESGVSTTLIDLTLESSKGLSNKSITKVWQTPDREENDNLDIITELLEDI